MTDMDDVLQNIAELTRTIQEHGIGDPTLDKDELVAEFKALLDQQQKNILDSTPVRPGAYKGDQVERAVEGYTGRYQSMIRGIVADGEYKWGNWKLRGADLAMAETLIRAAHRAKAAGHSFPGKDSLKPLSKDLVSANAALGNAIAEPDGEIKAMDATTAGTGDELVPTGMAAELWEDFFTASRIVGDLPTQPMPTDPFDMGLGLGDVTWRKGTANAATTATDLTTAKSILTSTEQVAEVDWSYNLDEDAVIAMMPAVRSRISISGAEQMDYFVLNADGTDAATGNINLDDANPPNDSSYLSDGQDGIRHQFLVDNTAQQRDGGGDALADGDLQAGLNLLDKYGMDIINARLVPGIGAYFAMLGLSNVLTVDKYGPQATILTGELGRYRGVPIIPSSSMSKTEADGKVSTTAGNNTLGAISLYNRNFWRVGFRRGLLIEAERDIQKRMLIMVVSFRIAVAAHGTRSSATHTAGIFNFTV